VLGVAAVIVTMVNGVIGSEKKPFFLDPQVKKPFAKHGYDVEVVTVGSRQIATTVDLSKVDFVFPSSAPAELEVPDVPQPPPPSARKKS